MLIINYHSQLLLLHLLRGLRPRPDFAHGSLAHCRHDLALHVLNLVLEVDVLFAVTPLAGSVPDPPDQDDEDGYGDGDDEVDPYCWRD